MKKILFISLLFMYFTSINGQSDYRPGFVILKTGDSIFGKIDFRTNVSNSKHCYFKKDSSSEIIEYLPEQLYAYRFLNSKYYISKTIKTDEGVRRVFLEYLISGKVSLFYSEQENQTNRPYENELGNNGTFYVEKDSIITEINNNISIVNKNGENYMHRSNQYIGVLKAAFMDCPEILKKVDNVNYKKESLIKISKDYHELVCKDKQCIVYEKSFSKRIYNFGIEFNYGFQSLKFNSIIVGTFNTNAESSLALGVFGAFNIDDDSRYILQLNIKYNTQNFKPANVAFSVGYPATYKYKFSSVLSDWMIKYRFSLAKIKPYANAGLTFGDIISDKFIFTSSYNTFFNEDNKERFLFGGFVGTGIDYSVNSKVNAFFSLRYNYIQSLTVMQLKGISVSTGFYF